MRVGVTGAAGFIGAWLVRELRHAGHTVAMMDQHPNPGETFDLIRGGLFKLWLANHRPDVVVHLAAQVGRLFGEDDESRTVRWNAEVTTQVARACGAFGIRLAYASTSEIYGDHGDELCDEDALWRLPANLYGLTKRWGEEVARLYAPHGLVIFRPSMPYGPGAPPGRGRRAMDTMLWQAHHRMPITVHRGAERSWCWIGDTVRGIRLAIEQPGPLTVNIGRDDDPHSMHHLAQMACDLAGAPRDLIEVVDPPAGQTVVKRLSTRRLRTLGWAPTVDLDDGMKQVYEFVRTFDRDGNQC